MPEPVAAERLAELPEGAASGEIRRIYDAIRQLSGAPMVALIYRHLATLPGVLEWSWALLAPALGAGRLQQPAWELAEAAGLPRQPRIPRAALRAAGLTAADEAGIAAVLDAYNRANPVNIMAVRCLALHLADTPLPAQPPPAWAAWEPPPEPAPLPPMVDPAAMPPAVRALAVLLTDRQPTDTPSPLWPSLYRHLAHWPAFLGYAGVLVPPVFHEIDAASARLRQQVDAAAAAIAAQLQLPAGLPRPGGAQAQALRAAIDAFSRRIPEMVVIGNLLRRALPGDEA